MPLSSPQSSAQQVVISQPAADLEIAKSPPSLSAIAREFQIPGDFLSAQPYGSGHINDTYSVVYNQAGARVRYLFQRINHSVFKNTEALMTNIQRVTAHLARKLEGLPDASRRALTLVPTRSNQAYLRDAIGNFWRAYLFVEHARGYDVVEYPLQAMEAARAFGRFQGLLSDLPTPRLHDTIPDFHHTPRRFAALELAIESDPANRAASAKQEIQFALSRKALCSVLLGAGLPERVTHNDTKLNNVLLDDLTGEGICVIDLDTVMPGLLPYDFGDIVRTTTSSTPEDERNLSIVSMQFSMFEAIARGYLSTAGEFITPDELSHLAIAGQVITFEIGLRFLTDFINGDIYFKVHRDSHNIDRCRTQFKLVQSMEQQRTAMEKLIQSI